MEGVRIRRALILGNGVAGAEHQCLGLVKELGLEEASQLQVSAEDTANWGRNRRVGRPRGGVQELFHWLPLRVHRYVAVAVNVLSWEKMRRRLDALLVKRFPRLLPPGTGARLVGSGSGDTSPSSQMWREADPKAIAEAANAESRWNGPLLVVASGADTVAAALAIKAGAPKGTFVVQIQYPHHGVKILDVVIAPAHDFVPLDTKLKLPAFVFKWLQPVQPLKNVIVTLGALHHADASSLRAAAARWHQQLAHLQRPLVVVNIGGPQRYCTYGREVCLAMIQALQAGLFAKGSARISFSRRTPAFSMLLTTLAGTGQMKTLIWSKLGANKQVHIWDGQGANPHLGHLAWADAFVVTADSVSMLSEACSTGKPVYVVGEEHSKWKLRYFHHALRERGAIRPLDDNIDFEEAWSYPPLTDVQEAAVNVRQVIAERGWII